MAKSLGRAIADLRQRLKLSQAALARAARLDPGELGRIESGERKTPSFQTVCRIAVALGVSLDELAGSAGLIKRKRAPSGRWTAPAGSVASLRALETALRKAALKAADLKSQLEP